MPNGSEASEILASGKARVQERARWAVVGRAIRVADLTRRR